MNDDIATIRQTIVYKRNSAIRMTTRVRSVSTYWYTAYTAIIDLQAALECVDVAYGYVYDLDARKLLYRQHSA